jgi:hypothetical protein
LGNQSICEADPIGGATPGSKIFPDAATKSTRADDDGSGAANVFETQNPMLAIQAIHLMELKAKAVIVPG